MTVQAGAGAETAADTPSFARGVAWMALATLLFVAMDAVAKAVTSDLPSLQATWGRFFFHALFLGVGLVAAFGRHAPRVLRSASPAMQFSRSLCMIATNGLFFAAISQLALPTATAVMFLSPLIVTLLAARLLGETVGWRRISSVAVGFLGALIIIRPGFDAFQPATFLVVAAACSHAIYQILTRRLSAVDDHLTSLAYTALVGALLATAALPFVFTAPSGVGWLGLAALGALGLASHFAYIRAFESAEASQIAPFGYLSLLWASAIGFVAFGEAPDAATYVGAAIIAASGVYILHRERVRRTEVASVAKIAR